MTTREPIFNVEEKSVLWMLGVLIIIHMIITFIRPDMATILSFALLPIGFDSFPVSGFRHAYGLVTSAFLHGDWNHLIMNGASLLIFGLITFRGVRTRFGPGLKGTIAFWSIYFVGVIIGSVAQWVFWYLVDTKVAYAIGASAGVSALFAAAGWVIGGWKRLWQFTLIYIVMNIMLVYFIQQIAWAAHAGGFVAGALLAIYWLKPFSAGTSILR